MNFQGDVMTTSKWQMFRFTVVFLGSQSSMFLIPGLLSTSGLGLDSDYCRLWARNHSAFLYGSGGDA